MSIGKIDANTKILNKVKREEDRVVRDKKNYYSVWTKEECINYYPMEIIQWDNYAFLFSMPSWYMYDCINLPRSCVVLGN